MYSGWCTKETHVTRTFPDLSTAEGDTMRHDEIRSAEAEAEAVGSDASCARVDRGERCERWGYGAPRMA